MTNFMDSLRPRITRLIVLALLSLAVTLSAQEKPAAPVASTNRVAVPRGASNDPIARIRDEGLNRSQVLETLSYLTDVIGPRLTGSPNMKRANDWTRDRLVRWGITNAYLEPWGPFGRGWSLKRFSAQVVEPQHFTLIACPKAWSPGFGSPLVAQAVLIDAKTEADLEKYQGKLKGVIALVSASRDVKARFEAPATRLTESELLKLANSSGGRGNVFAGQRSGSSAINSFSNALASAVAPRGQRSARSAEQTNAPPSTNAPPGGGRSPASRQLSSNDRFLFAAGEGAALIATSSREGDGGTVFVEAATAVSLGGRTNAKPAISRTSPWATNAPVIPPQIVLASEDFNRLVRLSQNGESIRMEVEFQTQFHEEDLMACNTIAEIPGTDLKEEVVMLGAHLDSWHSGTGATDNGAGVAVTMEALRILQALHLRPRRTIRLGLWSGEEQGLLGSRAYVNKHFGYYTNVTNISTVRSPRDDRGEAASARSTNTPARSSRKLIRHPEYDQFSAYFNLDNGTGKIRGIYMQGNDAVRTQFRRWLEPFRDLGAETLTLANTGGTDHQSFDGIGLPGFQFIQDSIEYWTRTHHSNADVFDRILGEDLQQAAVIMCVFAYQAAMADEKLPRKSVN